MRISTLRYIDLLFEVDADFSSINLLDKVDNVYKWASACSMENIVNRLAAQNNDTFLYLTARRCWTPSPDTPLPRTANMKDIVLHNLFLLPDDADAYAELRESLTELRAEARKAAEKAVEILENNLRQHRTIHGGSLDGTLACIFIVILHKNPWK